MWLCIVIGFAVAPPADTRTVAELILSLGADDFRVREAAMRRLMRHQEAEAFLQRMVLDPDLEVRGRAKKIIAVLRAERAEEVNRLAIRQLRSGRLDLAAGLLAGDEGFCRDSGCWREVTAVAARLYGVEHRPGGRLLRRGELDNWLKGLQPVHEGVIQSAPPGAQPGISVAGGSAVVPADRLVSVTRRAIFSETGGPSRRLWLSSCLIINAGGPAAYTQAYKSVILCGGEITLGGANSCLVIARGRVRIEGPVYGSTILSHSEVSLARPNFASTSTLAEHANVIREHQRGRLAGVRFFELDEFGLVIARGTDVARAVLPGVFRDAGLRPGDALVSVGGEGAGDAEQVRTLFMRHFLRPGPVFLKVRRGGAALTLYVNTPGPLKAP